MQQYLAQGIGMIGLLLAIISFQKNTNKGIVTFQLLASLAFCTHFILLGAFTGGVQNIFGAARNLYFFHRKQPWAQSGLWLWALLLASALAGVFTYDGPASLFPTAAMMVSNVALWVENPRHTRRIMIFSSPLWMAYNIINGSIAGIFTELFAVGSLVTAMVRFGDFRRAANNTTEEV